MVRHLGRVGIVACLVMAWLAAGTANASTIVSSCSATVANVFGDPIAASNPQQSPCSDGSASTYDQFIPLPGSSGTSYLIVSGPQSTTSALGLPGLNNFSAYANVGEVDLQIGNSISGLSLTATSARSNADASLGACPSTASTQGHSNVGQLEINGTGYDGSQPQTIDVPGVATISVNQQTVTNSTITQRALDIKLTALNKEIVIAESSAGGACT